jgi:hypothetical protein
VSPAEFRKALSALGLSLRGAGRELGVDARSTRRWASGEAPIPDTVAMLLRVAIHYCWLPGDWEQFRSPSKTK